MILKSASVRRIRGRELICILTGILTALLIALIPQGMFAPEVENAPLNMLFQFAGGFIIAVALVLPGISASQMLYMLGIYESTLKAVGRLDFFALFPLAAGGILGTFLTARILEQLIKKAQGSHIFNNIRFYAGITAVTAARPFNTGKHAVLRHSAGSRFCKSLFFVSKVSSWKIERYFCDNTEKELQHSG